MKRKKSYRFTIPKGPPPPDPYVDVKRERPSINVSQATSLKIGIALGFMIATGIYFVAVVVLLARGIL